MENNMVNNQVFKMRALSEEFLAGFKFVNPMVDASIDSDFKILMHREDSQLQQGVSALRLSAGGIKSSITITDIRAIQIEGNAFMYVNGKEFIGKLEKLPAGEVELTLDAEKEKLKISCEGNFMEINCDVVKQLDPSQQVSEAEAELLRYRVSLVNDIKRHTGNMSFLAEFALSQKNFVDIVKGLEKNPCIIDKEKFIRLRVFKERRLVEVINPETNEPMKNPDGTTQMQEKIFDVVEGISGDADRVSRMRRDGYMENGYESRINPNANINEISLFINLNVASNVVEAINKVKNVAALKDEPLRIYRTESDMYIKFGPARFMCRVQDLVANYNLEMFNYNATWCSRVNLADFKRTIELLNLSLSNIGGTKTSTLEVDSITRIVPSEKALRFEGTAFNGTGTSLKLPYVMMEGYSDLPPNVEAKIKVARKYIKEVLSSIESKSGKEVEIGLHLYKMKLAYVKDDKGNFVRDANGNPLKQEVPEMLLSITDATLGQYGVTQRIRVEVVN